MTERLYYSDAYLLEFTSRIVESGVRGENRFTILDRSAFYPTSGGQQHDTGLLNEVDIIEVIESESGDVLHLSQKPVGKPGDEVTGLVDADRRRQHRQQHTAQHIISQVLVRHYELETVSVHLGQEYGAIELEIKDFTPEQLDRVQTSVDEIVQANLSVEIMFADSDKLDSIPLRRIPTREGKLRIIRIGEFDYSACGGTHCHNTAEVGMIKIIGTEKMRGRTAVRFLSGSQAVRDYAERFAATDTLSRMLTCHPNDLADKIEKLTSENKALKKELTALQKELLPQKVTALAEKAESRGGRAVLFEDFGDYDQHLASQLAGQTADRIDGVAGLFINGRLIIATSEASGLDAGKIARMIAQQTGMKGGGNNRLAQMGGGDPNAVEKYRTAFLNSVTDDQA